MNADNSIATKYKKIEKPVGEGTYGVRARSFFFFIIVYSSFFVVVHAPRVGNYVLFSVGFFYFFNKLKCFFPVGDFKKKRIEITKVIASPPPTLLHLLTIFFFFITTLPYFIFPAFTGCVQSNMQLDWRHGRFKKNSSGGGRRGCPIHCTP